MSIRKRLSVKSTIEQTRT